MYFHAGSEETILFHGWTTSSWGGESLQLYAYIDLPKICLTIEHVIV